MNKKTFQELIDLVKNGTAQEKLASAEEIQIRIKALDEGGDHPKPPPNP